MRSPEHSLRPFVVTAVVGVLSVGLVILAAERGWLGPDVGRGARFCETSHWHLFAQPANTLSNLGFVLAGCLLAWRARRPGQRLRTVGLTTTFTVTVALLGPASMAMHATQSALGGHLDVLSMHLIAAFAVVYALAQLGGWPTGPAVLAFLALVAASTAMTWQGGSVGIVHHTGNALFGLLLVTALILEIVLWRRSTSPPPGWGVAAVLALLAGLAVWLASQTGGPWCVPDSWLQGHALWHVVCALSAYLLGRHYTSAHGADTVR